MVGISGRKIPHPVKIATLQDYLLRGMIPEELMKTANKYLEIYYNKFSDSVRMVMGKLNTADQNKTD